MKTKLIALLMILALTAACFAGCGAASADTQSAANENSAAAETSEAAEETEAAVETDAAEPAAPEASEAEEAEASAAEAEAEPAEAEVLEPLQYPISDETVELTMWTTEPTLGPLRAWGGDYGIDVYEDYDSIQAAAEITGVSIAFECAGQMEASTLFSLHVASGDYADILALVDSYYSGGIVNAYNDDVIMDLTENVEEWAPDYINMLCEDPELAKASRNDEGQLLAFDQLYNHFSMVQGDVIRTDWLEQVGMDVPTTVDELHEVLTAFQSEIGCANPFYYNSACKQLTTAFNVVRYQDLASNDLGLYQIDGEAMTTFTSENFKAYLTTMSQWYSEGLIDPDFVSVEAVDNGGHDEELLQADELGCWWANANSMSNYYTMCPAEDFDMVPLNIMAEGNDANHVYPITRLFTIGTCVTGTCLSSSCSDPEAAMGWLNFWYTEQGVMMQNYGIEGLSYNLVDGEVEYTDVITNSEFDIPENVALLLYSTAAASWGTAIQERTWCFSSDVQVESIEAWTEALDGIWAFPTTTLTTDESEVIAANAGDVCTYIAESVPRFIMGEYNLESDWDTYVENVNAMGMPECIEVYQASLDRFNAR